MTSLILKLNLIWNKIRSKVNTKCDKISQIHKGSWCGFSGGGGLVAEFCLTPTTPQTVALWLRCPWDFPRILEWVAIFFSRGSSWIRD